MPDGPVYIVSGGAGASRYARGIADSPLIERTSRRYHFMRVRIMPGAVEVEAVDEFGVTFDRFRVLPYAGTDAQETPLMEHCR